MVWTGVKGAAKFAAATATGDIADDATIEARRAICRECTYRVRKMHPLGMIGVDAESDWCGEPLVETPTTCGCLLAGKTAVGSEGCPQELWGPVQRARTQDIGIQPPISPTP